MNARDRLAAIAARAKAATPGPWVAEAHADIHGESMEGVGMAYVSSADDVADDDPPYFGPIVEFDAEFIAHARTDLPALVAFATAVLDELHTPFTADFAGVGARTYCVQCTEDSGYTAYPCAHVEAINRLADEHLGGTS